MNHIKTSVQLNGPNQIRPSDTIKTSDPYAAVQLKIPETGTALERIDPISVPGLLNRTAQRLPNVVALATKRNGKWEKITYREYEEKVRTIAKAFIKLGLEKYHSVCILGFNSPEWFLSNVGAIFAGGFACGIYTTNSSEACFHCAFDSQANIIVVQDEKQLEKILSIKSRLPNLKAIVQYEGEPTTPDVISWEALLKIGNEESDELLEETLKGMSVNDCCTLVYTSGTVGKPKGVMLSHDNLTWDALAICERIGAIDGMEKLVSYLPLSHVAAQVVDIYITMTAGAGVYFADKNALKGSLINTLQEVRPTRLLGVPRVWEKMYEKMKEVASKNTGLKKSISTWAKRQALNYYMDKINGVHSPSWGYSIASSVIFKKVRKALGLDECTTFVSAAAPLSPEVKKYFLSIDIPIMESFGMSEASGAHTLCTMENFGLATIGLTIPGMKTKLFEENDGQGEICMYGRHIFMGYLNAPEKTSEALDDEGWLHSGDLGKVDERGFVYITGRLKELLITAGGENVPPVPIEQLLKEELSVLGNAMLIGDQKKFLSILLTFKTEMDLESGAPLDTLTGEVKSWLKSFDLSFNTVSELLESGPDPKVKKAIADAIDKVNGQAVSNAQRIQKFAILPADFSVPTGELGPTMKIRRNIVTNKYSQIIDQLYN